MDSSEHLPDLLVDLGAPHRRVVEQIPQEGLSLLGGHLVNLRGAARIHVCVLRQRVPER